MALVCEHPGCSKRFAAKWSLKRHERTHTGEKPFQCAHAGCGMAFVEKCALTRHEASHSIDHPFVCGFEGCDRRFKLKEYLAAHEKTHNKHQPDQAESPDKDSEEAIEKHLRDRIVNLSLRYREDVKRKDATIQSLNSQLQRLQDASKRLLEFAQQSNLAVPEDITEAISRPASARRHSYNHGTEPSNNGLELLATRASIVLRGNVEPFVSYDQERSAAASHPHKRIRRSRSNATLSDHGSEQPSPHSEMDYRDVIAWMRSQPSQPSQT